MSRRSALWGARRDTSRASLPSGVAVMSSRALPVMSPSTDATTTADGTTSSRVIRKRSA